MKRLAKLFWPSSCLNCLIGIVTINISYSEHALESNNFLDVSGICFNREGLCSKTVEWEQKSSLFDRYSWNCVTKNKFHNVLMLIFIKFDILPFDITLESPLFISCVRKSSKRPWKLWNKWKDLFLSVTEKKLSTFLKVAKKLWVRDNSFILAVRTFS